MSSSLPLRAAIVSLLIFVAFIGAWHLATRSTSTVANMDPEYAKLMGLNATQGKSAMPGPLDVGAKLWDHIKRPFYDNGPNDKGLGIQLAYSIARVMIGYLLAVAVAIGTLPAVGRACQCPAPAPVTQSVAAPATPASCCGTGCCSGSSCCTPVADSPKDAASPATCACAVCEC